MNVHCVYIDLQLAETKGIFLKQKTHKKSLNHSQNLRNTLSYTAHTHMW